MKNRNSENSLITYLFNTTKMKDKFYLPVFMILLLSPIISDAQERHIRDTIIYNVNYRDTVIYRYETVLIKQYVFSDTLQSAKPMVASSNLPTRKKRAINPYNWGIGPSVGAYYSPYHGFDINIGFGVQYYLLSVPSFRNPHMGHKRTRK